MSGEMGSMRGNEGDAKPSPVFPSIDGPTFESAAVGYKGSEFLWCKKGHVDGLEIYARGDYIPEDHDELVGFRLEPGA
jgi:hypothetical protein